MSVEVRWRLVEEVVDFLEESQVATRSLIEACSTHSLVDAWSTLSTQSLVDTWSLVYACSVSLLSLVNPLSYGVRESYDYTVLVSC